MDFKTADNFFKNVTWFNGFFNDVKIILDKISNLIEKEQEYGSKWFYYSKSNDLPSIPNAYLLAMERKGKPKLQIIAIFDRDYVQNDYITIQEPSLVVLQHDYKENDKFLGLQFLDSPDNLTELAQDGGFVVGKLNWGKIIKLRAFQTPLDLFSQYRDQTVKDAIISKLADSL